MELQNIQDFLNEIEETALEMFKEKVDEIHKEVVKLTPVDTKNLKESIEAYGVQRESKYVYSIGSVPMGPWNHRTEDYSNIIMTWGRVRLNGKMYGSTQLPNGIRPHIRRMLKGSNIKFTEKG